MTEYTPQQIIDAYRQTGVLVYEHISNSSQKLEWIEYDKLPCTDSEIED